MKAERVPHARMIRFTEIPESDKAYSEQLTVELIYAGPSDATKAVTLDNTIIPAIIRAINNQPKPVDIKPLVEKATDYAARCGNGNHAAFADHLAMLINKAMFE